MKPIAKRERECVWLGNTRSKVTVLPKNFQLVFVLWLLRFPEPEEAREKPHLRTLARFLCPCRNRSNRTVSLSNRSHCVQASFFGRSIVPIRCMISARITGIFTYCFILYSPVGLERKSYTSQPNALDYYCNTRNLLTAELFVELSSTDRGPAVILILEPSSGASLEVSLNSMQISTDFRRMVELFNEVPRWRQ